MDFEKNVFNIDNENDIYQTDEINKIQQGKEIFHSDQERFFSKEKYENIKETNNNASSIEEKEEGDTVVKSFKRKMGDVSSVTNATSTGAASVALPGIAVSLVGAVAVIGVSSGLIKVQPSNNVSVFMSRSTELGFEINRDPNKTYVMYLSNADLSYNAQVDLIDQVIFSNLEPNTVYDLTVYETTVEPYKLVYKGNYLTKAYDEYNTVISNTSFENDYLTFDLEYDGPNIGFVSVYVYGDNNKVLYKYEGAPINQVTVDVSGNENVTCKVSVNGQVTTFEHLFDSADVVHVESVSLNKTSLDLEVGDSFTLEASVLPDDATDKNVSWSSSDENIATVNNGVVTAKNIGTATITVTSRDGEHTATCAITVTQKEVSVIGVSLSTKSLELSVGDSETLVATVLPTNATNKAVTWSTTNSGVATVVDGVVTAVGEGEAIITVKTVDGEYLDYCIVKVSA